jgi:hypothetical protein
MMADNEVGGIEQGVNSGYQLPVIPRIGTECLGEVRQCQNRNVVLVLPPITHGHQKPVLGGSDDISLPVFADPGERWRYFGIEKKYTGRSGGVVFISL